MINYVIHYDFESKAGLVNINSKHFSYNVLSCITSIVTLLRLWKTSICQLKWICCTDRNSKINAPYLGVNADIVAACPNNNVIGNEPFVQLLLRLWCMHRTICRVMLNKRESKVWNFSVNIPVLKEQVSTMLLIYRNNNKYTW